ncbi:hypothetical protein HaLaN_31821, partial [Haematococcus lacustris]
MHHALPPAVSTPMLGHISAQPQQAIPQPEGPKDLAKRHHDCSPIPREGGAYQHCDRHQAIYRLLCPRPASHVHARAGIRRAAFRLSPHFHGPHASLDCASLSSSAAGVCVCKTCCNVKLVLTVLAQHKAGLALELPGPALGATVPFPAGPDPSTVALPPRALGAAGEDGIGDTAHLLAADSPFVDPNAEFEHHHPDHHLPVPPPFVAASPTHLSATTVRGLYMCSCGPDAPHQARCCHRTCSDCKD